MGTKPKAAKLPLGIETFNYNPGWITKQTLFLFFYLLCDKLSKMHCVKRLYLGFEAICWHWESEMDWLMGLVNFSSLFWLVRLAEVKLWENQLRKDGWFLWRLHPAFNDTCCIYNNRPIFCWTLMKRKVEFWKFFHTFQKSKIFESAVISHESPAPLEWQFD